MKSKSYRRISDLSSKFSTVLGASGVFQGKLTGEGNYVIYGSVKGSSDIRGTLVLHECGFWEGSIVATNIVISGTVVGDIVAKEKLELTDTAKIKGNVVGGIVAVSDGAVFEGEIHITKKQHITFFNERRNGVKKEVAVKK